MATWDDLVDITLSERTLTEKGKYYMISLIHRIKKKNTKTELIDTERRLVVAKRWDVGGEWEKWVKGGQGVQISSHQIN